MYASRYVYVYVCMYVSMYARMHVRKYVFSGSETLSVESRLPFMEGSVLEGYFIIVEV